jgi:hypothetical protein
MAMLIEFEGKRPRVADNVFIAPTAVLIGDVTVEAGSSIWFGAVLRADYGRLIVGTGSNIQDNAVLHVDETRPTVIGRNVTVGHGVRYKNELPNADHRIMDEGIHESPSDPDVADQLETVISDWLSEKGLTFTESDR